MVDSVVDSRIYFMGGLPRSGSTLLGALLRQNPRIFSTPTSPLYHYLVAINECANYNRLQHTYDEERITTQIYHATIDAFYEHRPRPIIFDKNRMWPKNIPAIKVHINPRVRIVCPVRPIVEVITSYLRLAADDPDNFIDSHLKAVCAPINNESRAHLLWGTYIKSAYDALRGALQDHPENVLLVPYADLMNDPARVLEGIYSYCGIPKFDHWFKDVDTTNLEAKDAAWRMRNLHEIRSTVVKTSPSPYDYLPVDAVDYFRQFDVSA